MKKNKFVYTGFVIVATIIITIFIMNTLDNNPKEIKNENEVNNENYDKINDFIKNDFYVEGYEELLQGDSYLVGVPDSVNGIEANKSNNLYQTSRNFIYVNSNKSVIILLTTSKNDTYKTSEWVAANGYFPERFNSENSPYGFKENLPETSIFSYVIADKGYMLTMTAFSQEDTKDGSLALEELSSFTQELTNKLKTLTKGEDKK
ncbi:hypothetical protein [Chengkuizengella marina]|uniref:Uncharacterized protein n=1 Tax=Chengkuizengella marina TaxID=2507566 RepID=A0A6N9Q0E4_9BACL|nr:hypothetical protein [Chengkuizengella marina]NBI28173.1 hypothetical protein [Chengkuizengella marina]